MYDFIAESYKANLAAAGTAGPNRAQSSPIHRATPDAVASTNIAQHAQVLHTENGSNGAASDDSRRSLESFLIDFIVEQTGYPPESVDIDADLEADLGIDSIKKAQLFGELGEHFRIAAPMGNITLDDFPTLRHVLDFIHGASNPSGDSAVDRKSRLLRVPRLPKPRPPRRSSPLRNRRRCQPPVWRRRHPTASRQSTQSICRNS